MDVKSKLNKKKMAPSQNYGSSTDIVRNDLENYYIGGVYLPEAGLTKNFRLNRLYFEFDPPDPEEERVLSGQQAVYTVFEREERDAESRPRFQDGEPLKTKTYFTRMNVKTSESFFNEITSSFRENGTHEDSYFEIDAPIEYVSNVDNKSIIQGDVDFNYNFGSSSYEFLTNETSEQLIPNFYEIPTGSLKNDNIDTLIGSETVVDYIISNADYYDTTVIQQLSDNLPFFNMISFSSPQRKDKEELSDKVIDAGMSALFCDILNLIQSGFFGLIGTSDVLKDEQYTGTGLVSSYKTGTNQTEFSESSSLFSKDLQKYDLSYFIELIKGLAAPTDEPEDIEDIKVKLKKTRKVYGTGELNAETILPEPDEGDLGDPELDEKLSLLNSSFQSIIDKYSRNFEDILAGKKPYCSDVLFYSIEKYEFGSSNPIQTFWIPAVYIYLGLDYIDSQVKYGKKYTYKVFAYKITLDTRLEYTFTIVGDEERIDEPPDDEPPETKGGGPVIEKGDLPEDVFETVRDFEDEFGESSSGKDSGEPTGGGAGGGGIGI